MISPRLTFAALICLAVLAGSAHGKKPDPADGSGPLDSKGKPQKVKMSSEEKYLFGMRERLEVADDGEWQAMAPRILRVAMLSKQARELRDTKAAMEGKFYRPTRPDETPTLPAQVEAALAGTAEKAAALRSELDDKNARPAEIQVRLAAFRRARTDADRMLGLELARAREQLREIVTVRQELALVAAGLLD